MLIIHDIFGAERHLLWPCCWLSINIIDWYNNPRIIRLSE